MVDVSPNKISGFLNTFVRKAERDKEKGSNNFFIIELGSDLYMHH